MRKILFRLLDPIAASRSITRVLEAGSGTGYNASLLADRYQWQMFAADLTWEGISKTPRRARIHPVQANIETIPFGEDSFDALISLDVLVHFPRGEELKAVREFARVLRPHGLLIIRVSAHEVLRSRHAGFVGERQRFSRKRLVEAASSSGFRVIRCTYLNSFLVLVALIRFRIWEPVRRRPVASGTGPVPGWLDRLLYSCLAAEAFPLAKGINFPAGQSLLLLAEKKGAG